MSPDTQQAVTLYEGGLSPEAIAEQLDKTVEQIRLVLSSSSIVYRNKLKAGSETFSEGEARLAKEVMTGLLIDDSTPHLRYRAAKYILDEKTNKKKLPTINLNLSLIADQMKKAKRAIELSKSQSTTMVDVEPAASK